MLSRDEVIRIEQWDREEEIRENEEKYGYRLKEEIAKLKKKIVKLKAEIKILKRK